MTTLDTRPPSARAATSSARPLHPLAWWAWALALAVACSRTSNPVAIVLVVGALCLVVIGCREEGRWARAFRGYLVLAAAVVVIRLVFHVLVGLDGGGRVLLELPGIEVPAWAGGIELLGPVRAGGLLAALYAGLGLAALLLCFGAANALADPLRALRSLPAALHPVGTAVVVAVTVAPGLVASVARVRRAQRLRGVPARGRHALRATVVPVLGDALDHALTLAASMDARGYARARPDSRGVVPALVVALVAAVLGSYGLLDAQAPSWLGPPLLLAGAVVAGAAAVVAGRRTRRSRYRPQRWRAQETVVVASGVVVAVLALTDPTLRSTGLPGWPPVTWAVPVLAVLVLIPWVVRRWR